MGKVFKKKFAKLFMGLTATFIVYYIVKHIFIRLELHL